MIYLNSGLPIITAFPSRSARHQRRQDLDLRGMESMMMGRSYRRGKTRHDPPQHRLSGGQYRQLWKNADDEEIASCRNGFIGVA